VDDRALAICASEPVVAAATPAGDSRVCECCCCPRRHYFDTPCHVRAVRRGHLLWRLSDQLGEASFDARAHESSRAAGGAAEGTPAAQASAMDGLLHALSCPACSRLWRSVVLSRCLQAGRTQRARASKLASQGRPAATRRRAMTHLQLFAAASIPSGPRPATRGPSLEPSRLFRGGVRAHLAPSQPEAPAAWAPSFRNSAPP
jgi:hypothetical protein